MLWLLRHFYHDVWPPSMMRLLPVMKLLALLSRKSAAPLNSEVSARRPTIPCVLVLLLFG